MSEHVQGVKLKFDLPFTLPALAPIPFESIKDFNPVNQIPKYDFSLEKKIVKEIAEQKQQDEYSMLRQAQQQLWMVDLIASRKSRHKERENDRSNMSSPLSKPNSNSGRLNPQSGSHSNSATPETTTATTTSAQVDGPNARRQQQPRPISQQPPKAVQKQQMQESIRHSTQINYSKLPPAMLAAAAAANAAKTRADNDGTQQPEQQQQSQPTSVSTAETNVQTTLAANANPQVVPSYPSQATIPPTYAVSAQQSQPTQAPPVSSIQAQQIQRPPTQQMQMSQQPQPVPVYGGGYSPAMNHSAMQQRPQIPPFSSTSVPVTLSGYSGPAISTTMTTMAANSATSLGTEGGGYVSQPTHQQQQHQTIAPPQIPPKPPQEQQQQQGSYANAQVSSGPSNTGPAKNMNRFTTSFGRPIAAGNSSAPQPALPPKPAELKPHTANHAVPLPPRQPPRNKQQQDPSAPALPPKPFTSISEFDYAPDNSGTGSSSQGGHVEQLKTLLNMGFSHPQAIQALEMFDYDVNKASNYLIDKAG